MKFVVTLMGGPTGGIVGADLETWELGFSADGLVLSGTLASGRPHSVRLLDRGARSGYGEYDADWDDSAIELLVREGVKGEVERARADRAVVALNMKGLLVTAERAFVAVRDKRRL